MDKINFLITEVSLECLGNKFYDIHGNQLSSLLQMISATSLKPQATNLDDESALWHALTAEAPAVRTKSKVKAPETVTPIITKTFKEPVVPERKRRASFSNANNEPDTSNDPESLLVPMAPKAAKIARRRSTISVQQFAKNRKPIASTTVCLHNARRQQPIELPPRNHAIMDEIKSNLKRDIDARKFR